MPKLLVVEDSAESFELLRRIFGLDWEVFWAKTTEEGLKALREVKFDFVLLDLVLPDGDSFSLCSVVQSGAQERIVPVIFVSAFDDLAAKLFAFGVGADDFVVKPFDPQELKARVMSQIRRRGENAAQNDYVRAFNIEVQLSTQKMRIRLSGEAHDVALTTLEHRILVYLMKRPEVVVTRDELKTSVWGRGFHVGARSVDTHVSKLRSKLGTMGNALKAHHGYGYSFSPPERDVPFHFH